MNIYPILKASCGCDRPTRVGFLCQAGETNLAFDCLKYYLCSKTKPLWQHQ